MSASGYGSLRSNSYACVHLRRILTFDTGLRVPLMISQSTARIARRSCVSLLTLCLAACVGQPEARAPSRDATPVSVTTHSVGENAARIALGQVGMPYRYGGASPRGFDCSGLIQYSYQRAGKSVPRTTSQLWVATTAIDRKDMRAGDVLFFRIDGKMSHVGMYLGDNRFVHAPSSGKTVAVETLGSDYYRRAFIRAGRLR